MVALCVSRENCNSALLLPPILTNGIFLELCYLRSYKGALLHSTSNSCKRGPNAVTHALLECPISGGGGGWELTGTTKRSAGPNRLAASITTNRWSTFLANPQKKVPLTDPLSPGLRKEGDLALALQTQLGEAEADPGGLVGEVGEAAPLVLPEDQLPEMGKKFSLEQLKDKLQCDTHPK